MLKGCQRVSRRSQILNRVGAGVKGAIIISSRPIHYSMCGSTLRDGTAVTLRPIRPEDEPLMIKFHETLSDRSVYFRWLHMVENRGMQEVCKKLGFRLECSLEGQVVKIELEL